MARAGFVDVPIFGDFDQSPVAPGSPATSRSSPYPDRPSLPTARLESSRRWRGAPRTARWCSKARRRAYRATGDPVDPTARAKRAGRRDVRPGRPGHSDNHREPRRGEPIVQKEHLLEVRRHARRRNPRHCREWAPRPAVALVCERVEESLLRLLRHAVIRPVQIGHGLGEQPRQA